MSSMTLAEAVPDMLQALSDEVAAAAKTSATYTLDGGHTTVVGEENSFVEFPSADIERVDEGQEVTLQVGSASYDAEVVDVRRTEIVLFVRGHARVDGHRCRLKIDESSLVRALRSRLERVQAGEVDDFSAARADDLLSRPVTVPATEYRSEVLNASQRSAVSSALTPGITYLWGPPGTGKTTTVAHVVAAMAQVGLSVLLVSHTNAAVDLALRRSAEQVAGGRPMDPGRMLRYGRGVASVTSFQDGVLTPDGALAARGVRHRDLLVELQREIDHAKVARACIDRARDGAHVGGWEQRRVALEDVRIGLRAQLGDLESALVREAQVIGTTVHRAATGRLNRTFDAVVIDEASMVSLPTAWLCLGLAKTHALIAGDFRQLAPISRAESGSALRMLRRSLYERQQRTHPGVSVAELPGVVALTEQHRMADDLAEMIGRVFYPEIHLSTGDAVGRRKSRAIFPELPPLAGLEFTSPQSLYGPGGTQFNPASAQIFAGMIESAVAEGFEVSRANLLAMSPYRAQSSLLQKVAAEFGGTRATIEPIGSTVHRAQGDEAATVYFDLTESMRGGKVGKWYQGEDLAQDTSRLVNVALSRAKDQIVVLGDRHHVVRNMPVDGHPRRALEAVYRSGGRTVSEFFAQRESRSRFTWFTEGASRAASSDIRSATRSVAAFMPRLDDRAAAFARDLERISAHGKSVLITLGPPPGLDWFRWSDAAEQMRAAGLTVDLRSPMHFFGLIVDDRILWTFAGADGGVRTDMESLTSGVAQLIRARPPAGVQPGRQSDECRRCGRTRVLADTFFSGLHETNLWCPVCIGEPGIGRVLSRR